MTNVYEINKLNITNNINNIDKYITFLKKNLVIDNNELLIIIDLTINTKINKLLFKKKPTNKDFIKLFMYKYKKNIKYLKKIIKIDKRSFNEFTKFLTNKKRIYSYFEDINNTNINFYLPIILSIEYPNS